MPDESWNRILDLIDDRMVRSGDAQRRGGEIFGEFMRRLEEYVDYRPLFIPRVGKSRTRILRKVRETQETAVDLSSDEIVARSTSDIAAGRLLVVGLRDVTLAHSWCAAFLAESGEARFVDEPKKYLESAKAGGFRGIVQKTEIVFDDGNFPYELQIMTYLQLAWDQLQHKFYELLRLGDEANTEARTALSSKFTELSDRLFQSDQDFDRLRQDFSIVK